jgi:phage-related minor tail protein
MSKSEALHHIDGESHQTLQALKEAVMICTDEQQKLKEVAEEDSMITQQIQKVDKRGSLSGENAKQLETELADVDRKLKNREEEAKAMVEEIQAARKGVEQEMKEIREVAK